MGGVGHVWVVEDMCVVLGDMCGMLGDMCGMLGDMCGMLGDMCGMLGDMCGMLGDMCGMLGDMCGMLGDMCGMLGCWGTFAMKERVCREVCFICSMTWLGAMRYKYYKVLMRPECDKMCLCLQRVWVLTTASQFFRGLQAQYQRLGKGFLNNDSCDP